MAPRVEEGPPGRSGPADPKQTSDLSILRGSAGAKAVIQQETAMVSDPSWKLRGEERNGQVLDSQPAPQLPADLPAGTG